MSQTIQSLVVKNGKYIVMPVYVQGEDDAKWGNLAHPNPHANSSVGDTSQQYPHGTAFVDGDRVFYYGYINATDSSGKSNIGVFNLNESATGTTASYTWGATAGVAGDTTVYISYANFVNAAPSVDDFAGGWMSVPTNPYGSYRILGNSVVSATTTNEIDFYIEYGLSEAVTAGATNGQIHYSQYTKLGHARFLNYGTYATCPGVTLIDPIASTWQWIQSWGPCFMGLDAALGTPLRTQLAYFGDGGSVAPHSHSTNRQFAGYLMPSTGTAFTMSHLVFLQVNRP